MCHHYPFGMKSLRKKNTIGKERFIKMRLSLPYFVMNDAKEIKQVHVVKKLMERGKVKT